MLKSKLAKGYLRHSALLAIVLGYDPSFCLNTPAAGSTPVLGTANLSCLSWGFFSPVDSTQLLSYSGYI